MTENWLILQDVSKNWPMKRVSINASMQRGESLALLGPSGCGKSTILRMIAGLLPCDGGRVTLNGRDITALPPGKRGVGLVFQEHALFSHMSVEDNIGYGLVSSGMPMKEARRKAGEWLERFSLSGFAHRRPDTLSGGEKQRVSLARTLAVRPDLVLFDEPLSALDTPLRAKLREELRNRQRELGYTAIYVTHDADEAAFLADRSLIMD